MSPGDSPYPSSMTVSFRSGPGAVRLNRLAPNHLTHACVFACVALMAGLVLAVAPLSVMGVAAPTAHADDAVILSRRSPNARTSTSAWTASRSRIGGFLHMLMR